MKHPTIISLGEVLWDLFPDGERFGGAPANFACHAAVQGADVTMLSAVGDDQHGRDGIDILSAYGIDVSPIQIISEMPTGTVGVEVDVEVCVDVLVWVWVCVGVLVDVGSGV